MTHATAAVAAYQEIARMTEPDAKPRLEAPLDSLAWPDVMKSRPTTANLHGNQEADAMVRGWLAFSEQFEGRNDRYTELRLYKLAAGGWAACVGHRSDVPGEVSFWTVRAVRTIEDVMEAWNWTIPAKRAAKSLGWDVRRRL